MPSSKRPPTSRRELLKGGGFPPVRCQAARLKIVSTWNAKSDAHVFSFELA